MAKFDPSEFDTKLSKREEIAFQRWMLMASEFLGRDISKDVFDYDLRGQWKYGNRFLVKGAHGSDKWKKPNHPTFSDESIYSGITALDGKKYVGGTWLDGPTGLSFLPSKEMFENRTHEKSKMINYMRQIEPGVSIVFPDGGIFDG